MRRLCRRPSQQGRGNSLHPREAIHRAGPTRCKRRHRFTPCITQGLIIFLLPPQLSPYMGGWGGLGKPLCYFASLQPAPVHSYTLLYLLCLGREARHEEQTHLSLGRVITASRGPCTALMLAQDRLIPSRWSPKASVLCPPEHAQQRRETA